MTVLLISFCAFLATLLGGMFAIRFKDRLHLILGFSAGAVLGVAFFDLLPEALTIGTRYHDLATILSFVAAGFIFFMIIDRSIATRGHHDHEIQARGKVGATSLIIHSFLDGVAIGLAFQVSTAVGIIVATAVLVHDFSDGINTVGLIFKNRGESTTARTWLTFDAVAPIFGAASTLFFRVPESVLAIILAIFSGFFLYIGASDLLPESYHGHPTTWTTCMTVLGAGVLFIAIKLAGI